MRKETRSYWKKNLNISKEGLMWFIEFLFLVIGGALVIPDMIGARIPGSSEIFKKAAPYRQWFGLIMLIWSAWDLLSSLLFTGRFFVYGPLSGILLLVLIIIEICLGLILSMNFLKNIKELPAGELLKLEKNLGKFQSALGIGGIIAGIYIIIRSTILFGVRF